MGGLAVAVFFLCFFSVVVDWEVWAVVGGHGGHGKFNPLLLTLLGGCKETHTGGCTQPTVANGDANQKCGMNDQGLSCQSAGPNPTSVNYKPCCTCPDTPSATS